MNYHFELLNNSIQVYQELNGIKSKIGSISDTCCSSRLYFNGRKEIDVFYDKGQGGYIKANLYINEIKELYLYAVTDSSIMSYLSKRGISISKATLQKKQEKELLNIFK